MFLISRIQNDGIGLRLYIDIEVRILVNYFIVLNPLLFISLHLDFLVHAVLRDQFSIDTDPWGTTLPTSHKLFNPL